MSNEDQLSDAERELETALRSLRPTPARIVPQAAALAAGRRAVQLRLRFWQVAAAAAVIAAVSGAWLTLGRRGELSDRIERQSPAVTAELAVANKWSTPPLTFAVYRQALTRSPADLEALLDRQASESARNQFSSGGMPTVWNVNYRSSLGEM